MQRPSRLLVPALLLPAALALADCASSAGFPAADPGARIVDLYAFVAPDAPQSVTLIANYQSREPSSGPLFPMFDDSALYALHVDHDGDCVADVTYELRFTTAPRFGFSPLYAVGVIVDLDGFGPNFEQLFSVTRVDDGGTTLLGSDLRVPPAYAGPTTTPDYDALAAQAVVDLGGTSVFCGPRDDSAWMDASLYDLFTIRPGPPGTAGGGVDGRGGFNVLSICLQIPIAELTADGSVPTDPVDPDAILGVWATTSRPEQTDISGGVPVHSGPFVQVTRRGNPLVDELMVGLGEKQLYRGAAPASDAQFTSNFDDPELATLLTSELGIVVPASPRSDLVEVYLSGLAGINQVAGQACDMLRLNVAIPPAQNEDRLGVLGGDTAGFPNGRRLVDDVVDITLSLAAGARVPGFETSSALGDGVRANDVPFSNVFPYLATPHSAFLHSHHPMDPGPPVAIGGVEEAPPMPPPLRMALLQNVPNPFNPSTRIVFRLPERADVTLTFYDARGRRVDRVEWRGLEAGTHDITPQTDDWASGTYFYVLTDGTRALTRRMTLIK